MTTVKIYQDNQLKKEIKGENASTDAFGWMLRNQGNSVDYALRWGGYVVEETNDETGEKTFWKPYSRIQH